MSTNLSTAGSSTFEALYPGEAFVEDTDGDGVADTVYADLDYDGLFDATEVLMVESNSGSGPFLLDDGVAVAESDTETDLADDIEVIDCWTDDVFGLTEAWAVEANEDWSAEWYEPADDATSIEEIFNDLYEAEYATTDYWSEGYDISTEQWSDEIYAADWSTDLFAATTETDTWADDGSSDWYGAYDDYLAEQASVQMISDSMTTMHQTNMEIIDNFDGYDDYSYEYDYDYSW